MRWGVENRTAVPTYTKIEKQFLVTVQAIEFQKKIMTDPNQDSSVPQGGASSTADNPAAQASQTGSPDAAEGLQGTPELTLEERLSQAEARAAEYMDLALRSRADLDNLRKRSQQEVAAAHKFAIEGFAESLLPVRDSLEMALTVASPSVENLREGVEATLRLLATAFERHKLLAIEPVGEKFDPNRHQAISMLPSATVPANHVVAVLQKGFLINERVLRPAMVTVSSGT
jgi:molecular chaperone GrpE